MLAYMRKRSDIHTFEDEWFLTDMRKSSIVVLLVGIVAALVFAVVLALAAPGLFDRRLASVLTESRGDVVSYLLWMVWTAAAAVVALAVHELVHGVLFKAFAPRGSRVTFGANLKQGMLYACAEGVVYARAQYLAIALAPTVIVTPLVLAAGFACGCPVGGAFAAVLHLSGCTGDWGYVRALRRDPLVTHCEDTSYGVCFYGDDDCAPDSAGAGVPARGGKARP